MLRGVCPGALCVLHLHEPLTSPPSTGPRTRPASSGVDTLAWPVGPERALWLLGNSLPPPLTVGVGGAVGEAEKLRGGAREHVLGGRWPLRVCFEWRSLRG